MLELGEKIRSRGQQGNGVLVDLQDSPADRQARLTAEAAASLAALGAAHLLARAQVSERRAALERLSTETSRSLAALRGGRGRTDERLGLQEAGLTHAARARGAARQARLARSSARKEALPPLFKVELVREYLERVAAVVSRGEDQAPGRALPAAARDPKPTPGLDGPGLTVQARTQLLIDAGLGQEARTHADREIPSERRQRAREKAVGNHAH